MEYPILEIVDEVKNTLANHTTVLLQAPPGAGKSTILPLKLLELPWLKGKKIIMLEPRRLAARTVAQRMASLKGEKLGESVGYRIRFDTCVSKQTVLEVVTEGILTRMLQNDSALDDVGLVIFDEFHERSLQADLAMALCLQVQQVLRDDLRLLIMSATLDGDQLLQALGTLPVVTSSGRQYPVTLKYNNSKDDDSIALPVRISNTIRKALRDEGGDILVFLPGAAEINKTAAMLENEENVSIHLLYGDLPFQQQQAAIMPHPQGTRKIVLATSIAETSLTIEGVRVVIDCGLSRVPRFDPRSGLTRLETVRVTKDAADQRTGRAGRLGPGVCYRLWSEGIHASLQESRRPEILEADLAPLMLELAQWGVKDVNALTWITTPPVGHVQQALTLLEQLEAINQQGITTRGKEMLQLPTHPRIAHLLLEAPAELKSLACDLAALLEERDPLDKEQGADVTLRIEVLRKWRSGERVSAERQVLERIEKISRQWRKQLKIQDDNTLPDAYSTGKILMKSYPERVAKQVEKFGDRYRLSNGRVARLQSHDPLVREPWLSIAHLDAGTKEGKIFLAAPLHPDDLHQNVEERLNVFWDDDRGMIAVNKERVWGGLVLDQKAVHVIAEERRIEVLCNMIREKGLHELNWSEAQQEWQARVMSLHVWRKEEPWPDVQEEALLKSLEVWLAPFLINCSKRIDLQRLDWNGILPTLIPWELNSKLDVLAPTKILVPSGSWIRVQYNLDGSDPVMEVRLQEMFGLTDTPTVNEGRVKIKLHLLSPGYKPVQVTQDLKSFWHTTYHEVRKELRMRYPKHHWPEDPWTAEAVRGTKRNLKGTS